MKNFDFDDEEYSKDKEYELGMINEYEKEFGKVDPEDETTKLGQDLYNSPEGLFFYTFDINYIK